MTRRDDRSSDMLSSAQFDAAIERVLRGEATDDAVVPLAGFVDDVRVMATGPPPRPAPELAAILAGSRAGSAAAAHARPRRPRAGRSHATAVRWRIAASGVAGKAAVSLALAGAVAAGGATGILPEPAAHLVRRAIEVVTPFELPDDATDHHRRDPHPKADAAAPSDHELSSAPLPRPRTSGEGAVIDARSADDYLQSVTEPTPEANPPADASGSVSTHPKKATSPAQGPKPAPPTSYAADNPANPPSPRGGPATKPKPGPQRDHVPPGRPQSAAPHPGNSPSGGPAPTDRGPAENRPTAAGPEGSRSGPGSPAAPPPGDGTRRSSGGPPPAQPPQGGPTPQGGPDLGVVVPGHEPGQPPGQVQSP